MRIEIKELTKRFDVTTGSRPHRSRSPGGRIPRPARALGLGQDDVAAHPCGPGVPRRRTGPDQRRGCIRAAFEERQIGFVFQHYALFNHMSVFENVAFGLKVRPRQQAPVERRNREARRGAPGAGSARRPRGSLSRPPVGRPAAARRAGPRARDRPQGAAARRAVRRARRQGAGRAAPLAARHPRRYRPDHGLRHPRSGGGARPRRPGRRHEPRPDRADRHARRKSTRRRRRPSSSTSSAAPMPSPARSKAARPGSATRMLPVAARRGGRPGRCFRAAA